MEERFGIPQKAFSEYLLLRGSRSWSLLRNDSRLMAASQLKVCKTGLKAFRKISQYVKPTTRMIQIFGKSATTGKMALRQEELFKLLRGDKIPVGEPLEAGYVILTLDAGLILGMGFVEEGMLRSELPRRFMRMDERNFLRSVSS